MLQAYDWLLIAGIMISMFILYAEISVFTSSKNKPNNKLKVIAIFGVLFFLTATIVGAAVNGYVTKDAIDDNLSVASNKLDINKNEGANLKYALFELQKDLESNPSITEKEKLLSQIAALQIRIDNLLDTNRDLEDELGDLNDQIKELYTLIPGGHY
ncbi:MAG: hypothetical protein AABX05_04885 [Nanoarchaeota archaeon]